MANLHVRATSLIPTTTAYPATVGTAPATIRAAKTQAAPKVSAALEATATALSNVQGSLNAIHSAARHSTQAIQQIFVTDNTGKVIAAIGDFEYQGVVTPNYFSEIHVGDPLNTGNPALALFNAVGGNVTIGQNGAVNVLDPFGNNAAWIGTQADTEPVTGAADNGSGLIRLTITSHTYSTGDQPTFQNVGGVPNSTGIFTVTKIDANHIDLQASVFVGTYTSGGTGTRILHISGATSDGGLVKIQTAVAHGYTTGDEVNIPSPGPGGVTGAVGQWIVTVIDSTHFDLQGSTFGGTYTSGGTCLRYFAGMLAQTFAVGPSFPSYKLRAFADGSLRIQNAIISLSTASGTILLDPSVPQITATDTSNDQALMSPGAFSVTATSGSSIAISATSVAQWMPGGLGNVVVVNMTPTAFGAFLELLSEDQTKSVIINPAQDVTNPYSINTTGDVNVAGVYRSHGLQVVGAQMAAVGAPSISTSNTASTAGATYTTTEQGMLNTFKTAVGQLNTDVTNLQTAVNAIRGVLSAALGGHGLTA